MPDQPRTDLQTVAEQADRVAEQADRVAEQADRERLVEDLESRLEELEALDDSDIGSFTALDWFFCIAGSVVVPALALWWFAG